MTVCRRFLVSGKVQGVFYRDSTQQQALALGLTGYVKNLPDGRVELEACGNKPNLDILLRWLWKGPIMSKVADIHDQDIKTINYTTFSIH